MIKLIRRLKPQNYKNHINLNTDKLLNDYLY